MGKGVQRGSFAAVPTPLTIEGEIDTAALVRILEHIVDGGCAGVLVLGSSGEVAALTPEARRTVIETATSTVGDRATVLSGIANPSLHGALADLALAEEYPLDAVVVTPPYYGPVEQSTVAAFYRALAAASSLPILGYHIPAFTGVRIDVETARELAADGTLAGIKDSNRDFEYFQQVADLGATTGRPWSAFVGTDSFLLPALMADGAGGITLAASVAPSWAAGLVAAVAANDHPTAVRLQERLTALVLALRRGSFPAGAKAALSHLGLGGPTLAPPATGLGPEAIAELGAVLDELGVTREGPRPA